jgi:hypothetical protein
MAKVINRSRETIHVGGHVLGNGEHDLPDFEALAKQYPGLSKLVEVVKPVEDPKPVEPEPDATKQPAKEPEEPPKKEASKKAEK